MSDFETAHQLEQAKASHQEIPAELSFEDVIKNRTCPVSGIIYGEFHGILIFSVSAMLIERLYGLSLLCRAQRRVSAVFPLVLRLCRALEWTASPPEGIVATLGPGQSQGAKIKIYHL